MLGIYSVILSIYSNKAWCLCAVDNVEIKHKFSARKWQLGLQRIALAYLDFVWRGCFAFVIRDIRFEFILRLQELAFFNFLANFRYTFRFDIRTCSLKFDQKSSLSRKCRWSNSFTCNVSCDPHFKETVLRSQSYPKLMPF